MKRILVLDGGGARGMIQASALSVFESAVGPLHNHFDLIVGTSIGSIVGGAIASGKLSAGEVEDEMKRVLPEVFKKRFGMFFRRAKYSKEPLFSSSNRMFGINLKMIDLKCNFVGTSINDMTGKVHFFKSWEKRDGDLRIVDVMDRSSAAPVYFGAVPDESIPAVWIDGGVGLNNNPSAFALVEAARLGWDSEGVQCVNLGTGYVPHSRKYKEAKSDGIFDQALNYMKDGGYAHRGAERVVSRFVKEMSVSVAPWFEYRRFDTILDEKLHKMDAIKYLDQYQSIGKQLGYEMIRSLTSYVI